MEIQLIVIFLVITILITSLMYVSLQRIDLKKVFKANSTIQIKAIITCLSLAIGFIIASGFLKVIELIINAI